MGIGVDGLMKVRGVRKLISSTIQVTSRLKILCIDQDDPLIIIPPSNIVHILKNISSKINLINPIVMTNLSQCLCLCWDAFRKICSCSSDILHEAPQQIRNAY